MERHPVINRFHIIPIKISVGFFAEIDKLILKLIHMEFQGNQNSQITLKKNKVGGLILPNFKTYYKATGIKTI